MNKVAAAKSTLHFHPLGILLTAVRQVSVGAEIGGDNGFKTGFIFDLYKLSLLKVGLRVIFKNVVYQLT